MGTLGRDFYQTRFLSDKISIRQDSYHTRFLSEKIYIREDGCLSGFSFAGAADLDSPTEHLQASSWRAAQRDDNTSTRKFIPFPSNFHSSGISSMVFLLWGVWGLYGPEAPTPCVLLIVLFVDQMIKLINLFRSGCVRIRTQIGI